MFHFVGIILLSLHFAETQRKKETLQTLTEILAFPGDTVNISCDLPGGFVAWDAAWYKEKLVGTLRHNEGSSKYKQVLERYPSRVHNLQIGNVQRNDSGVYYCIAFKNNISKPTLRIVNASRLIISDAPQTRLLILAPFSLEENQINHSVPLLCLFFSANPTQGVISWNIGGETYQDQKVLDTIDGKGAFSLWSLKLIPPERWAQRMPYTCSGQENGSIRVMASINTGSTSSGSCSSTALYVGVPGVVLLLLIPPLSLLFRKHRNRGNSEQPANQIPMQELPQTEYADICHNKRNAFKQVDRVTGESLHRF